MAARKKESFHSLLVLNRWLLSMFQGSSFAALKERLNRPELEGMDPSTGHSNFYDEMTTRWLIHPDRIPEADLSRYDLSVVKHWQAITEERNRLEDTVMQMKYFQYLSLLFTEIYLDWYFNHRAELLAALNEELRAFNAQRKPKDHFQPFEDAALNKIAFWNATGSGKTLLLHVNILQYLDYAPAKERPDKIILLTPNEGLSRQHIGEARLAGFAADFFADTAQRAFSRHGIHIDVLDINKLGEERGDKVFAVESFEGNNLVLVDEGHRGTSSDAGTWLQRRETICAEGFSFEYSATFGQAVSKSKTVIEAQAEAVKKKAKIVLNRGLKDISKSELNGITLTTDEARTAALSAVKEQYAKCILFDYSYKYFYEDGYGKESLILNLQDDRKDQTRHRYLTACLLSFYQQQWLWETRREQLADFNLERPLWIFVGNKVNDDDSDVLEVVRFLAAFLNDQDESLQTIDLLRRDEPILLNGTQNIFAKRFLPIMDLTAEEIYSDLLLRLFNAPSRQRLKVVHLKGGGELALRLGDQTPFGLINIGDSGKFAKLCENEKSFDAETDDFGKSMFPTINDKDSDLNILIGSRKFTEGWSSWRVSTMGLLNMGQGEGSQIIQLFGRGVRLKGRNYSLQRSRDHERPKGSFLPMLETLNIFGIRADYMAKFKDYLREEGITPSDEMLQVEFETQRNAGNGRLKTLRLQDGYRDNQRNGFKRQRTAELYVIPDEYVGKLKPPHAKLDMYPHLQAFQSQYGGTVPSMRDDKKEGKLTTDHLAFIDWDAVYLHMLDFKNQRTWYNLRIDKIRIRDFCQGNDGWYTLYIPPEDLEIRSFSAYAVFQEILIRLLEEYTEAFYQALKKAYEDQFYEVATVSADDDNYIQAYQFEIENTEEGLVYEERLNKLKDLVVRERPGEASEWDCNHIKAICFDRHLYYPLMHITDEKSVPLKMHPLAFDAPSEATFVRDLSQFYGSPAGKKLFKGRDLYLMRNSSTRSRGVGFARAGNFYPDFLLWVVDGDTQYLSVIDPKGIRQVDLESPKLQLYREISEYETQLDDPDLKLSAFILSDTKWEDLLNCGLSQGELETRHILFLNDGGASYLPKLFEKMTNA